MTIRRSILQYKPKGEADAPSYAPQRDIANLYSPMLGEVFAGLDRENWTDEIHDLFAQQGVTSEDIGAGVTALTAAHQSFIRDRSVANTTDALQAAGWFDVKPAVRIAIMYRFGLVLMGGFFIALRDVTQQGQPSAVHTDYVDMLAAGRQAAKDMSGDFDISDTSTVTSLEVQVDELKRVIEQNAKQRDETLGKLVEAQTTSREYRQEAEKMRPAYNAIEQIKVANFSTRIQKAVKLAWRLIQGKE